MDEQNQDNLPEEYRFQTYFQVNNLLATRVKGDSSKGFSEAELEVTSPIFYCPQVVNEVVYTDLMIGVRESK